MVVVGAAVGLRLWSQYRTVTSDKYSVIDYTVPSAPHLVANNHETVFRIDPTHSALSYSSSIVLARRIFRHDGGTTRGETGASW